MSIASEITRIQNAKASIKTSIENKGVTVGDGTLDTYASKIDEIETGITPTGTINITENGTYDVTDKASANVNVEGLKGTKIEITKNGTYIPEEPYNAFTEVDVATDSVDEYFGNTIKAGVSGTPGLVKIIKKIPLLIIEDNSCNNMFNVYNIGLVELPKLDTSNCIAAVNMCSNCISLETIPLLDFSKMATLGSTFYRCNSLKNLGGLQNLGQAYLTTAKANYGSYKLELLESTKLTHDSLMNVINNLYDIATKGCNTQQVVIGSTNLAKLTAEEIAIATNKGWSVS